MSDSGGKYKGELLRRIVLGCFQVYSWRGEATAIEAPKNNSEGRRQMKRITPLHLSSPLRIVF
ncbi:MAG: hypothetical protein R6V67_08090, partial [Spirochaetia bacterium]